MRILRRKHNLKLSSLTLVFTFWVATSACLHAQQSLVNAPLPSYYAGHTASIQIAEPASSNAAALPPTAAVQVAVVATSPNPGVPALVVDSPVPRAHNSNTRLAHREIDATRKRPEGAAEVVQSGLPAIGTVAPAARDAVRRGDVRRESEIESGLGRGEAERDSAKSTDAERRATLPVDGDVYDGLPIERRFERRTESRVEIAPRVEAPVTPLATEREVEQVTRDGQDEPQGEGDREKGISQSEDDGEGQNRLRNRDADEEEEDDDDCEDELEEHFEAVERVLNSKLVLEMLGLLKENTELKAQLKIQEIEFEARRRVDAVEHEQQAAQRRIHELEIGHEHQLSERHDAAMRMQAQAKEATQHSEMLQRELAKSAEELNELRAVNQQLQQQVERVQASHAKAVQESLRKLAEAQQSKAELEHRARALEAHLKELRDKLESPRKEDKKKNKR